MLRKIGIVTVRSATAEFFLFTYTSLVLEYGPLEWNPSPCRFQLLCYRCAYIFETSNLRHYLSCHLFIHAFAIPTCHGMSRKGIL